MRVLILTDNEVIYQNMKKIFTLKKFANHLFQFMFSYNNAYFMKNLKNRGFLPVNLKVSYKEIMNNFDLVISAYCKQIFPTDLVNNIRCVNIHPGLNPFNRGWYPQVFSIINKLPCGVTIHEMDEFVDHGPIIVQKEIKIEQYETSSDVYKRLLQTSIRLIKENLGNIIDENYKVSQTSFEGNLNLRRDFVNLLEVDMDKISTYREVIDFLRAMTFKGYNNAYFYDNKGEKVFLEINLIKEKVNDYSQ